MIDFEKHKIFNLKEKVLIKDYKTNKNLVIILVIFILFNFATNDKT